MQDPTRNVLKLMGRTVMVVAACVSLTAMLHETANGEIVQFVTQPIELPTLPPQPSVQPTSPRVFSPFAAAGTTAVRTASSQRRLARTPAMFGDFLGPGFSVGDEGLLVTGPTPLAAGRIAKVSENNLAITGDRCFVLYNHFHNAQRYTVNLPLPATTYLANLDRITIGLERRLGDGLWSIDVRMPFLDDADFRIGTDYASDASQVGNLAFILKRVLYQDDHSVFSAGLGTSLPTGGNLRGELYPFPIVPVSSFRIQNQAVHLMPFLATQHLAGPWFCHGFAQCEVPMNGNRVDISGTGTPNTGVLQDQTLLFLDLTVGRWLRQTPGAPVLRGIALLGEVHYTTALQNADVLVIDSSDRIGNLFNRFDMLNATAALQVDLGEHICLRVGGVVPIAPGADRMFDSEAMVQIVFR